jgi:uncharacterized protein YaiI (UPF0178 family)
MSLNLENKMIIWLDADGCPNEVKECVFKAAIRTQTKVMLVADRWFRIPPHSLFELIVVTQGFNAADEYIIERASICDIAITDDIPLAHSLVLKDVTTISRRGQVFDKGNIGDRLATRDLMEGLRTSGLVTGGPKPYGNNEKRKFAETFDRLLVKLKNNPPSQSKK